MCRVLGYLGQPVSLEAGTTSGDPGALELKRRIVAIACGRLRRAYRATVL